MPKELRPVSEFEEPERRARREQAEKLISPTSVRIHGQIARGVIRGRELIDRLADRLEGLLGFRPYLGTLNVRIERPIDIEDFETKRIQHILMNGSLWIDARMAPIKLQFKDKVIDAWIIFDERSLSESDVLEVVHKERLMDKLGLKLGDEVTVELTPVHRTLKSKFKSRIRAIWPKTFRVIK